MNPRKNDFERAVSLLHRDGYTCVLCDRDRVLTSREHGLAPLRLGSYPCRLDPDSRAFELYGEPLIHERHRHRYEVNNDYRTALTDAGMRLCGMSPDGRIVEMLELPDHPYFLATQAHPEFNSRPNHPHPLFLGLISSAVLYRSEEL